MQKAHSILSIAIALMLVTLAPSEGAEKVKLNGYAEWRQGDVLVVEGQRVRAAKGLRVKGSPYIRDLRSIPLGYEVKVEGYREKDGTVLARKVEAKPNGSAMFEGGLAAQFDQIEAQWRRRGYVFQEAQRGRQVRLGELLEDGPRVERVRRITARLVPPSNDLTDFRVYVIENEAWNAMAAPNGSIYAFSGLVDAMDDDELAIILGHEMVHATHEHSRRQYKRGFLTQLGVTGALDAINGGTRGMTRELAAAGAMLGALAFTNAYSREHEDQADRVGLRYAHEGGYDVSKAPGLWLRFAEKYGERSSAWNFFVGDHSTARDRARNLEREISLNYN